MRTAEDTADIKIPFKAVVSLNSKHQFEKAKFWDFSENHGENSPFEIRVFANQHFSSKNM